MKSNEILTIKEYLKDRKSDFNDVEFNKISNSIRIDKLEKEKEKLYIKIKELEDKLNEQSEQIKDIYEGPYGRVYFESLEHFNSLK